MKTPAYWQHKSMIAQCLRPLSWLYRAIHQWRMRKLPATSLPVPVICVGNITAGGAGKTPTVIALAQLLQREFGVQAHVLSRGYGGSCAHVTRVDAHAHSATEVGDEPLLIARVTPCWIARKRLDAAHAAMTSGASLLLMDDGLQNPTITKTASLLVIDGGFGIGNGYVLPAGALRESWQDVLSKASAVVMIGHDTQGLRARIPAQIPVFQAMIQPLRDAQTNDDWMDTRVVAFAGIARPQKFYDTLRQLGVSLQETHDFSDHYAYTHEDVQRLINRAHALGAQLVTTEKDLVRIPKPYLAQVKALPVGLVWDDEAALVSWLRGVVVT
jgi:tetraacyldisaccharide 4'-kinase